MLSGGARWFNRRFNPLTREWVLVSPHRTDRPWQGQIEKDAASAALAYDLDCYLCPGNTRFGGQRNPKYETTFVFDNDYPALDASVPDGCFVPIAVSVNGVVSTYAGTGHRGPLRTRSRA